MKKENLVEDKDKFDDVMSALLSVPPNPKTTNQVHNKASKVEKTKI